MQRPRSPLLKYCLVAALTAVVVGGILTAVLWRRTAGGVASAIWRRIAERRPEATVLDLKTRPDMARFAYDRSVHEFSRTPPVDQAVNDPESPAHAVRRGLEVKAHSGGYTYPVNIAFAPEPETPSADAPFYYVAELHGTIQYATRGGDVRVFASGLLEFPPAKMAISDELGLSGLAVIPGTRDLLVTHPVPDRATGLFLNAITRLRSADGGRTLASAERVLTLEGEATCPSNQIQQVLFGPDGKLYASVGDAMNYSLSRDPERWGGKILRMNPDGSPCEDNPFRIAAATASPRSYAYSIGLRNSFDFLFDPDTRRIWAGDVGEVLNRIVDAASGTDHGWDGTPESFCRGAAYLFQDRFVPAGMALIDGKVMGAEFDGCLWIAGYSYYFGPDPGASKRIISFRRKAGSLAAGPLGVVAYKGRGQSTMLGLEQGPDGVYFTDFFGEQLTGEAEGMGKVFRVAPSSRTRDFAVDLRPPEWASWSPRNRGKHVFARMAGCGSCHRVERLTSGREGPDLTGLVPNLRRKLFSEEYGREARSLLAGASGPAVREVLEAGGDERLRAWIRHHIRDPRFDNPKGKMPGFPALGDEETTALVEFLMGLEG
jgi:mono/diheme cytochrome c family protein